MSNTTRINALKSKIEKLKRGISSKTAPETAKSKAKILIGKFEKKIESLKEKPKKRGTKSTQTSVAKARLLAAKRRAMQGLSTSKSDIEKDAQRPALPTGKRISKDGNTYYEYRENRIDRRPKKYARLEDGGEMMSDGGKLETGVYRIGKPKKVSPQLYEQKIVEIFDNGDIATASDYGRSLSDFKSQKYPIISNEQLEAQYKMADGGEMMADGGMMATAKSYWNRFNKEKRVDFLVSAGYSKSVANDLSKEDWDSLEKGVHNKLRAVLMADGGMMENDEYGAYKVTFQDDTEDSLTWSEYAYANSKQQAIQRSAESLMRSYPNYNFGKMKVIEVEEGEKFADGGEMMAKGGMAKIDKLRKEGAKVTLSFDGSKSELAKIKDYVENKWYFNEDNFADFGNEIYFYDIEFRDAEYIRNWAKENFSVESNISYNGQDFADGGEMMAFGGRTKSAIMRDRAYKSDEPHEQSYKRKSNPKNPRYNKYAEGGEMHRLEESRYGNGGVTYNEIDKEGMMYALVQYVSSGTIASITDVNDYESIDNLRRESIKYYMINGDKPYSMGELENVLLMVKGNAENGIDTLTVKDNDNTFYLRYIDSTHFFLSNSPDSKGNPYHVGEFRNRPFYNQVNEWLKETYRKNMI
jgi:hypothetical protein